MRVVFVADKFASQYVGGAELSIQTHIDSCTHKKVLVNSKQFNPKKFNPKKDFLIFGNFFDLNREFYEEISKFKYVVEECDYKYCRYRSSHKHEAMELKPCDCHKVEFGQNVYKFFQKAKHVFWKSEGQMKEYARLFSDLGYIVNSTIVGGVFSVPDLDYIWDLRLARLSGEIKADEKYFVLYSDHWIKGHKLAKDYCRDHKLPFREVGGMDPKSALKLMAQSKGIVYFPRGFDVSCRMITEAKLLGIEVITDPKLVQHMGEKWFNGSGQEMIEFLSSRDKEFWRVCNEIIS